MTTLAARYSAHSQLRAPRRRSRRWRQPLVAAAAASPPAAPDAYTLRCEHFGSCSGCTLAERLDAPPLLAQARAFFADLGVPDFRLTTGPVHGWRNRARLAVRGKTGAPQVGLFAAGTHAVVPIPRCSAHHPSLNAAAAAVAAGAAAAGTPLYDDADACGATSAAGTTSAGALRYVQLATLGAAPGAAVELSLVWAAAPPPPGAPPPAALASLAAAVRAAAPPGLLASLWANYHPAHGNAVVGAHWARLDDTATSASDADDTWHWERFGGAAGADVAFAPGAFLQANYGAFDALCAALAAALPRGCALVDMYAGTGALGLASLASGAAASLTAVEVTPAAAAPFAASAARLAQRMRCAQPRMRIAPAGGSEALEALAEGDALVVDPPRRGLDAPLLTALCARSGGPGARLRTLAYVSCGFAALRRDAVALRAAGWTLKSAQAFQFFPGTDALETLAVFVRGDDADMMADASPEQQQQSAAAKSKPARRRNARRARRAALQRAPDAPPPAA